MSATRDLGHPNVSVEPIRDECVLIRFMVPGSTLGPVHVRVTAADAETLAADLLAASVRAGEGAGK